MSSNKKDRIDHLNYQRDEQFQIQNIADDSSQNSSRRGDYEVAHFNDSEEQHERPTSIKSLDEIQSPQQKSNTNKIKNQALKKENSLQEPQDKVQHVAIQENYKSDDDKQAESKKQQQLLLEGALEKKKRKRKRIFQKIKQSSNQKPKHKTNHQQNEQTIQTNKQHQVLNRVAFEKKRQNHTLLKAWNYRRLNRLQFHKNISEQLVKNIDRNTKSSLQIFEVFHTYFVQRCRQQQIQLNFNYQQNQEALSQNQVSRNIHIANSIIFKSLLKRQRKQKQIILNFVTFMQTKILKQIFQQYLDNTHKQYITLREKITLMKETINKFEQSVCAKLIRLQKYFSQCCENVTEETSVDFYRAEMSYLSKCQAEMAMENKFGQLITEYYIAAMQEELKRKLLLQKSLALYRDSFTKFQEHLSQSRQVELQKLKSMRSIQTQNIPTIASDKDMHQIQQLYKLQNLLEPQTITEIQQKMAELPQIKNTEPNQEREMQSQQKQSKIEKQITEHTQEVKRLQLQQFKAFYLNYEMQEFDCYHLIMKKFQVQVYKQGKWIPGEIVITIDKFVHIFVSARRQMGVLLFGSQIYYKPEFTLKIHFIKLSLAKQSKSDQFDINSYEDLQVKIGTNKQLTTLQKMASFIKSNVKMEQTVRFSKENDLIEFQDYVQQLAV